MIELALLLFGLGSTQFTVTLRDAASGQPVDGAFVVAREFATVGKLHGSTTYCTRADVAHPAGPRVAMQLPHAGINSFSGARAIEAFAYRPGYCVARNADGAATSRALYGPGFSSERPKGLDPSVETRLELRRSTQTPVDRLLYLDQMVRTLACGDPRWSDRGREGIERLSNATIAEAQGLARSRYEKSLAENMKATLVSMREMKPALGGTPATAAMSRATPFPRDFIVGDPDLAVSWDGGKDMVIVAMPRPAPQTRILVAPSGSQPGQAAGVVGAIDSGLVMQPGGGMTAPRPGPAIRCRNGAPSACDLNERDAQGAPALQGFVAALKVAEVKLLLEAGADPSVVAKPSNVAPIDALFERMTRTHSDSNEAESATRILEMLAADPRVTLRRKLRDDFATDPATWNAVQHSPGRKLLALSRARMLALPVRDETPACPPLGYTHEYGPPLRLRYP